jgi:hypothetical protein
MRQPLVANMFHMLQLHAKQQPALCTIFTARIPHRTAESARVQPSSSRLESFNECVFAYE